MQIRSKGIIATKSTVKSKGKGISHQIRSKGKTKTRKLGTTGDFHIAKKAWKGRQNEQASASSLVTKEKHSERQPKEKGANKDKTEKKANKKKEKTDNKQKKDKRDEEADDEAEQQLSRP